MQKTIAASNGCEWAQRTDMPPAMAAAIWQAQKDATPEAARQIRLAAERIKTQELLYRANCE